MKKVQLLLLLALATAGFTACHEHDTDENAPVVTIESPTTNATISGAISLDIRATDESLHEMSVVITRDSDESELYSDEPTVHDETDYHYQKTFTPSGISAETALTLTVTVEDHEDHKTVKTVKFKVAP